MSAKVQALETLDLDFGLTICKTALAEELYKDEVGVNRALDSSCLNFNRRNQNNESAI